MTRRMHNLLDYSGITSAKIKYSNTGLPQPRKVKITNMILTIVGSHPRYSAIPPHTPEIILSVLDFFNLALIIRFIYGILVYHPYLT